MMMPNLPLIFALSPSHLPGGEVVAAAGRAGALGILNLSGLTVAERTRSLCEIDHFGPAHFGVRGARDDFADHVLKLAPGSLTVAIVTETDDGTWSLPPASEGCPTVYWFAEVTSTRSATAAIAAGYMGLIASGHEAGGTIGEDSSFILLQGLVALDVGPVWVRGGVGPRMASGCVAAGAAGVVLDGALLLARESQLPGPARARIAQFDGSETTVVRSASGRGFRGLLPKLPPRSATPARDRFVVGWGLDQVWPIGQDSAFAAVLAQKFVTVGGIVSEVARAIGDGQRDAARYQPLSAGASLAESHGTRYPIVQGPMTRVSDNVRFAQSVADGGALPFLALAMLRGDELTNLVENAAEALRDKSWGVGVLAFVEPDLRREQMELIRRIKPPFALIAGGRPDQARDLEQQGIATYLHVPSPHLLRQYLRDGARRFVFEGRECGGHVGPRSSFVLWEQVLEILDEEIRRDVTAADVHALFAGGIHDARSAALIAAAAARLAGRGVRVGVLMGTPYLFTEEAVATGAIVAKFQAEAIACEETVLLETGPGHEIRVRPSPFSGEFEALRRELIDAQHPTDKVREHLEKLNAGRLRVASKGIDRVNGHGSPLFPLNDAEQLARGLYMLGQSASLRREVTTIAKLHVDVCMPFAHPQAARPERTTPSSDIAIVGISGIFPQAPDVRTFWENTLHGLDTIQEIPADRWDWRVYYDANPKTPDKIISKWGGFVPDIPFDPLRYGMPPNSLDSIEPVQLLTLEAVRAALEDAGYADRAFPKEKTSVVLGIGGGAAQLAMGYAFRAYLPMLETVEPDLGRKAMAACGDLLPEWTEDSFAGFLLNVAAGRVANRFDLGGSNYTVDAACGSSLAAANLAVRELETGAAEMVILGGADTVQNPLTYLAFSKTHAFSPRGRCRPFDASADGIVISEGVAAIVLKRLADAERDGDRIYAVIKGIGSSSDGRARGLTAPLPEGQVRALDRAYAKAGVDPRSVGYVEAHGTGTAVGDVVEVEALAHLFRESGAEPQTCAVGSVKSSIGHTKCAAGMAGLINAALALHHRILPPTIGVETPNPRGNWNDSPLHISTKLRPWFHHDAAHPRRAGVSAFGFGGTNFHAVLEAYDRNLCPAPAPIRDWSDELCVWSAPDRETLRADLERLTSQISVVDHLKLRDLAHALALRFRPDRLARLAIIAHSVADLVTKIETFCTYRSPQTVPTLKDISFTEAPATDHGKVAFLFPGQGSQSIEMLLDLAVAFSEVRSGFETFDAVLTGRGLAPISPVIFPPTSSIEPSVTPIRQALTDPRIAQLALGASSLGVLRLLTRLGLSPDMVAGHSFGEVVALHASGACDAEALVRLSQARGQLMSEACRLNDGGMLALSTDRQHGLNLIAGIAGVELVNDNGPNQVVVAGPRAAIQSVREKARQEGIAAVLLPVAAAFHTDSMSGVAAQLEAVARTELTASPLLPVYSNLDARPHPAETTEIAARLGSHASSPVQFDLMIRTMHADGARVFLEVGPGSTLSGLVRSILSERVHVAVAVDGPRHGTRALIHALGQLAVAGIAVDLARLTTDRTPRPLDLDHLSDSMPEAMPASTWLVNGSRSRPMNAPESPRLGQASTTNRVSPTNLSAESRLEPNSEFSKRSEVTASIPLPPRPTAIQDPRKMSDPAASSSVDRVMLAYQETMRKFLDVQRDTMLAYLSSRPAAPALPGVAMAAIPPVRVAEDHLPPPPVIVASPNSVIVAEPTPSERVQPVSQPDLVNRDVIAACLIRIVQDRTGYPSESLRLDLNLESDLGIDSIKRIEILGTLRDAIPALSVLATSAAIDQLASAPTLGAIVDRAHQIIEEGREPSRTVLPPTVPQPRDTGREEKKLQRLRIEVIPTPAPRALASLPPSSVVLLTEDGRGVAAGLAAELHQAGYRPVIAPEGLDWTSPNVVESWVDKARETGLIAALVHVSPLQGGVAPDLDPLAWGTTLDRNVKSLFLLSKTIASDLERSASFGGASLVAATSLGGLFATRPGLENFSADHGAIAGLVKTLARELSTVRVRVVDFASSESVEGLVGGLQAELFGDEARSEIGYDRGRRSALNVVPSPLDRGGSTQRRIERGQPIILSGGARGITAAVARELVDRWQPRLLILGVSAFPDAAEDPLTAGIEDVNSLRALLLRATSDPRQRTPAFLEPKFRKLVRDREIRRNIAAFRAGGSEVDYASVDVCDEDQVRQTLAAWSDKYGPPAGFIHGAGVIHDKLIQDKSSESFDRVLRTKIFGAINLCRHVDPMSLQFTAFFSSIAGRFGNRGQSDYAAANEALNKLAVWLDRRWPGRVVSTMWGPWSGTGMVADLEGHLTRQGLGLISAETGAHAFADELQYGVKGDVEILLTSDLGSLEHPPGLARRKASQSISR